MMRRTYQLAAAVCAELVWRVPSLERPFVDWGGHAWGVPGVGRFYRSTAHRLAERLRAARAPYRTVTVGGHQLVLDVSEFTAGPLYFGGAVYEPLTTGCLVGRLAGGRTFVDVGANTGYFSLLAAKIVGASGRVIAFEPNPQVCRQLQAHVALNGVGGRVAVETCALGAAPSAAARLYVSRAAGNSGLSSLTPDAHLLASGELSDETTVSVPVETFDRWMARARLARVDLVKIDVEGAESQVVAGMSASLEAGRIAALIVETTWGSPAHASLVAAGYVPERLDVLGPLTNVLYSRSPA